MTERVEEAGRLAAAELRDQAKAGSKRKRQMGGGKDDEDRDDDMVEAGLPSKKHAKGRRK